MNVSQAWFMFSNLGEKNLANLRILLKMLGALKILFLLSPTHAFSPSDHR